MARYLPCCGFNVSVLTEIRTGRQHVMPQKGDVTICINCGSWHRYTDNMNGVRAFRAEDLNEIPDEEVSILRRATRAIKKRGRLTK